ncbi:MAG: hypothetical protein HZB53_00505 [Chloroflexi bacterium]|nr:hypothetical protein [Chloroflexota bacterium]
MFGQKRYAEAQALAEQSIELAKTLPRPYWIGGGKMLLAAIATEQQHFDLGEQLRHEALEIFRQIGDSAYSTQALRQLSGDAARRGDYATASALIQESLSRSRIG